MFVLACERNWETSLKLSRSVDAGEREGEREIARGDSTESIVTYPRVGAEASLGGSGVSRRGDRERAK